jgi:DNA repair protein RadD
MSVFSDVAVDLSNLRECQREAAQAATSHYSIDGIKRHTIIQLPTGTGKSALIAALPFSVPCTRVLVLVPNLSLVTQMCEDLDTVDHPVNNAYRKFGLLTEEQVSDHDIYVMELSGKANRTDIANHQIIVANYHKFQDIERWFGTDRDLIDLIIIDEAHHQAAGTYRELIKFFDAAKIIGLTATPFRSDGKPLEGERIYLYRFSDAIKKKYIRNIEVNNVAPDEVSLYFTESGSTRIYTLDEILEVKEDRWFNRQISLSQECCNSIADLAVGKLRLLRESYPEASHQIIAAAMTIRHARDYVKLAFERHGLKVGIVSSHAEDKTQNDKVKLDLKQGKIDVIVNVGMLGEGFNQPTLGVAAIFRPYKTLNPYLQFIGRVLRNNEPARRCHVVSHLGLNQVRRFEEFRLFDSDDKDFLKSLFKDDVELDELYVPESEDGAPGGEESQDSTSVPEVVITQSEGLSDTSAAFVDEDKIQKLVTEFSDKLTEAEQDLFLERLGLSQAHVSSIKPSKVKPLQKRLAKKNNLNEQAKSITTDVLKALGLKHKGRDFNKMFPNFGWVQRHVNKKINAAIGIEADQRNGLTTEQIESFEASGVLDSIKADTIIYFEEKRSATT